MSILFSYPKSCTRPVKLSIQGLHGENDHLDVDLLRMVEGTAAIVEIGILGDIASR